MSPLEENLLTTAVGVSLFGAVLPALFFVVGAPLVSGGIANILTSTELPIAILSASLITFLQHYRKFPLSSCIFLDPFMFKLY